MKILHVIPSIAPRYGGPSQAVIDMARASTEQGHDVLVATTNADGPGQLDIPINGPITWNGVRTVAFQRQWSEALKYSRPLARWLDQHVADFDVVHIHAVFSHACIAAGEACRKHHVPYVVRPLGTLDPWSLGQKPLRKKLMWWAAAKTLVQGAAAVHYTSSRERQATERALVVGKGSVVSLGVGFDDDIGSAPVEAADHESDFVLYLGRLHPKKNLEVLIDAFVEMAQSHPALHSCSLVLAGGGDSAYARELQRRAAKTGNGRITFAGWLTGPAKVHALRSAKLVTLISRQENFGLSAVEAMHHGVPVLVSRHIDLAEEIGRSQAGWVCEPSAKDVASALAVALEDEPERQRRGANAKELAAKYDWTTIGRELSTLYHSIAHSAQC